MIRRRFGPGLLAAALIAATFGSTSATAQVGEAPVGAARFDPAEDIAIEHIVTRRADFGLLSGDVADIVVADIVSTEDNATTIVYLQQRYGGVPILEAVATIAVSNDGSVVSAVSRFHPRLSSQKPPGPPRLPAVAAEASAMAVLGITSDDQARALPSGDEDIPTELVLQPLATGRLVLAWQVTIVDPAEEHWWQIRIDANTGEELDRTDLVSGDSYLSIPLPAVGPGWGQRIPLVDPADDVASPFGWHDTDGVPGAESTLTIGNNVTAYTDVDGDNQPDAGSQPDGGAALDFGPPFDASLDPAGVRDADVVSLFALTNTLHDILYSFGFDESSGNFQTNNYGRGGAGSDPVRAEAQNGGAVNNANFVTPPDGFPARMQFYLFDATDPNRSASLDNTIVAHEYGHGLSNRLTGGPSNVSCLQNDEQPGEGWSDYLALILTSGAGSTRGDERGIATYALGQPPSGPGIRLAPYSTDMAVDTRSYGDVASASIPFGVGSVLTSMLWDMTWDLADRYGFDPNLSNETAGNHIALQLVIDGLKLQPCNPGFTDVRNAILVADEITNSGLNTCLIWEAFARRGLGWSADQGSPLDRSDGTPAFDTPPQCAPLAIAVVASDTDPEPGSTVRFDVTVSNNDETAQTNVSIAAAVGTGSTVVGGSITCGGSLVGSQVIWTVGSIGPESTVVCSFDVMIDSGPGSVIRFFDDLEDSTLAWTASRGAGTADWALTSDQAKSPVNSYVAADLGTVTDQRLTTTAPIELGVSSILRFWHAYDTEVPFDGGVVEVSSDGVTWVDAEPFFVSGGYDATLAGGANPLANRPGFSGDSGGFVEAVLDLGSFATESIRLRFRFGSDASVGGDGWYIDDIRVADEVAVDVIGSATSDQSAEVSAATRVAVAPAGMPKLCDGRIVTVDIGKGQIPTSGNDVILGTDGDDLIDGGPGDDAICGGAGDDDLRGGAGSDLLLGGAGADVMSGGEGDDIVLGYGGDDTLLGGDGSDYLWGGAGIDEFDGGDGRDYLDGNDPGDAEVGGGSGELMSGGEGDDIVLGYGGDDVLDGDDGVDYVWGGPGHDIVRGGDGDDDVCVDPDGGVFDATCEFTLL